jgi:hypothetical protein
MKKSLFTISFVLALGIYSSTAQSKSTKKADEYFNKYEYTSAVSEYLKLIKSNKADNYVYKSLATFIF